ncbi:MAG TPA: hypothetical protein PK507_02395, partial [bacterium]|nr:hypothetical protein [bacterium]
MKDQPKAENNAGTKSTGAVAIDSMTKMMMLSSNLTDFLVNLKLMGTPIKTDKYTPFIMNELITKVEAKGSPDIIKNIKTAAMLSYSKGGSGGIDPMMMMLMNGGKIDPTMMMMLMNKGKDGAKSEGSSGFMNNPFIMSKLMNG